MSLVTAKVTFHNITNCGYYTIDDRKHAFCTRNELLKSLSEWIDDKEIFETLTFSPQEDSSQNKIYCYDMHLDSKNGCLLTTWNGYPSGEDNQIAAINGTAKVGESDVTTSKFDANYIPGFETYFWFPQNKKALATIRFERTNNGRIDLVHYLESFLAHHHPEHVLQGEKENSVCYGRDKNDFNDYIPMFKTRLAKLPGQIQTIKNNRAAIIKLRQQSELRTTVRETDSSIWQKMLTKLGVSEPANREYPISFDTYINWTPSKKELDEIITQWEDNPEIAGRVGVVFKGDSTTTHWFDSSMVKAEVDLDVEKNDSGIIGAESLFNALEEKKEQIFAQAYKE